MSLPVCNQNYVTTDVTIHFIIYVIFSVILFLCKSQFSRKSFCIINIDGLVYLLITFKCIYIYNQIARKG